MKAIFAVVSFLVLSFSPLQALNIEKTERDSLNLLGEVLASRHMIEGKQELREALFSKYRQVGLYRKVAEALSKNIVSSDAPSGWTYGLYQRDHTVTVYVEAPLELTPRVRQSAIFIFDVKGSLERCVISTGYYSD